jgi:hypothetical protein
MKKIITFTVLLFCLNNVFSQSNFINQDTIFGRTADCASGVPICIDSIAYDSVSNFRYFVDGQLFNGSATICSRTNLAHYAYSGVFHNNQTGPWQLDSWTVNGRTFSTVFDNLYTLLDSMQSWDPSAGWRLDTSAKLIYGYTIINAQYSNQLIRALSNPIWQGEILYGFGNRHFDNIYQGLRLSIPTGVHQLVVEKISTGQRDTVTAIAACMSSDTVRKEVVIESSQYYCFDTTRLLGRVGKMFNVCRNTSTLSLFDAPSGNCIRYLGRRLGTDTACLMLCDDLGNCATTTLIVKTKFTYGRILQVYDTINVGLSRDISTKLALPIGNITFLQREFCIVRANPHVSLDINPTAKTTIITGLSVGTDTICITACSNVGYCDTTILYVSAVTPQSPLVIDTTKTYMLIARSSQQALSIREASTTPAADAVQSNYTGGLNQKWRIKNTALNTYSLSVGQTNMNLDTRWGATRSGSRLMQWAKNNSSSQKWQFIPLGNGYYKIINNASGRALSVKGGINTTVNNAYLVQLNYTGLASQQWRLDIAP